MQENSKLLRKQRYKSSYRKYSYNNLGQNLQDRFKKISKTGFPMERFTANFLKFSNTTLKIRLTGVRLCSRFQLQPFWVFFLNILSY